MASIQFSPAGVADASGLRDFLRQRSTVVLLCLGVLAVIAHATFRIPLNLPGHHGLEWMALLVIARQGASYRWAAGVVAIGAAVTAMVPAIGFHNPLTPLYYLVPALALDLMWRVAPVRWHTSVPALAGMAALAFATKPLVQAVGLMAGVTQAHGGQALIYVIAMHMVFALVGGAVAAALWQSSARRRSTS
ncbi:hypothetical protein [Nitrogeniibacter mangrovi]|nr:hypothetical protein [Nitrogeniibacter mangrovi]